MFALIIEIVNALPDTVRFVGMDTLDGMGVLDAVGYMVKAFGYILFEDGSIGTRP